MCLRPQMVEEAGWSAVTAWGPNCTERVRGTDAFQFRPRVARGQQLRAWIAELFRCRQGGGGDWDGARARASGGAGMGVGCRAAERGLQVWTGATS